MGGGIDKVQELKNGGDNVMLAQGLDEQGPMEFTFQVFNARDLTV